MQSPQLQSHSSELPAETRVNALASPVLHDNANIRQPDITGATPLRWHIANEAALEVATERAKALLASAATEEAAAVLSFRRCSVALFDAGEQLAAVREFVKKTRNWVEWQHQQSLPTSTVHECIEVFVRATKKWDKKAREKVAAITRTQLKTTLGIYKPKHATARPKPTRGPKPKPNTNPLPHPQPTKRPDGQPTTKDSREAAQKDSDHTKAHNAPAPDGETASIQQIASFLADSAYQLREVGATLSKCKPGMPECQQLVDLLSQLIAAANSVIEELR